MLIEVNNNLFINAKNISYVKLRKNYLEFTELGNEHLTKFEISDEGEKELREFFKFDEDFIEISSSWYENQYINIRAIGRVSINEDKESDEVRLNVKLINDTNSWIETLSKENALKIINKIREKNAELKPKYVDHF